MQTRRRFIQHSLALLTTLGSVRGFAASPDRTFSGPRIPVILASDIGDDIDDTWALLMLLRMPQFEVKLVVSDFGNAIYRCRLFARLLELTGCTDIPIGVGVGKEDKPGAQSGWIGDYRLQDYPGVVHEDGVGALIDTIQQSPQPVTLICIGPTPTIAAALSRTPSISDKARFLGMHGSLYLGYDGKPEPAAEWNVKSDPGALQQVFAAPWDCTIMPLDVCGLVEVTGTNYRKLHRSDDRWLQALMENYKIWFPHAPFIKPGTDPEKMSTTLFDTVAIYAAQAQDLLIMEELPLRVTDDGYTVIDERNGRLVNCATGWKDLAAFENLLVEILLDA